MFKQPGREALGATLDASVTSLLVAAAAPTEPGPMPGEEEATAIFRASQAATRRPSLLSSLTSAKAAVAALVSSGVLLTGGVGAATAGFLPDAAQNTARDLLSKVGVTVPSSGGDAAAHTDGSGTSGDSTAQGGADAPKGKDAEITKIAHAPELQGVDKGAAVSRMASDGKSQAGKHGWQGVGSDTAGRDATRQRSTAASDNGATVATPNSGGTGTAGDATSQKADGASSTGTRQAGLDSAGRSADGSGNRP